MGGEWCTIINAMYLKLILRNLTTMTTAISFLDVFHFLHKYISKRNNVLIIPSTKPSRRLFIVFENRFCFIKCLPIHILIICSTRTTGVR